MQKKVLKNYEKINKSYRLTWTARRFVDILSSPEDDWSATRNITDSIAHILVILDEMPVQRYGDLMS